MKAIYAQIAEVDPGEDCWPFSDTVVVVGDIPIDELDAALEHLQPDEVGPREHDPLLDSLSKQHGAPCLVAWWD